MARVVIVSSGHLCTNPRVWREADALATAGHDVTVTGVWLDSTHAEWDRALLADRPWSFVPAADLRGHSPRSAVARLRARARSKVGRIRVHAGLGDDPHALGYAVDRLERTAFRLTPDLVVCHLEPGLWVAERLAARGVAIALDIEDWYSENDADLPATNAGRMQVAGLEQRVFARARATTTTSHAMAHALAEHFGMAAPGVVYNGTSVPPIGAADATGPLRLVWVSQTIGVGRGLEELLPALRLVEAPWQLTLIGSVGSAFRLWAEEQLGAHASRLRWRAQVPPEELPGLIATHHVGLALELPLCRNKDLTVSNKLFHYLQGGLAVVASDTAGQREVMRQLPSHGALFPAGDVDALAERLSTMAADDSPSRGGRAERHAAANARFDAALQGAASVRMVAQALETA